jgi:hypothetical protein
MQIKNDFAIDGILPLSSIETSDFREMMFGKTGAADAVAESYIGTYDALADFRDSLDRNLTKFTFAKHSLEEWKRRYVFPNRRLVNVQLQSLGVAEDDLEMARRQVINLNAEAIRHWTQRNLIDPPREAAERGASAVVYVQGTVGSGKSSLNKYITNVLFEDFVSAHVIPSRIECRKLLDQMLLNIGEPSKWTRSAIKEQLIRFIKESMLRDIIHYTRSRFVGIGENTWLVASERDQTFPDFKTAEFLSFVEKSLADNGRAVGAAMQIAEEINRVVDVIGRTKPTSRTNVSRPMLRGMDDFAIDLAIGWHQQAGVRYALLLDGFDYIDAADFFSDSSAQSQLIEAVADWIQRGECRIPIACSGWIVEPNVSLTIRRNTRSILGRKHNQIYSSARARSAFVLSPSMRDLYHSLAKDICEIAIADGRRHEPQKILRIINRVRRTMNRELELVNGLSIGSLFNGNVRHQINYTRDVIYELAASLLRQNVPTRDTHSLVALIDFEVANYIEHKSYRLVDMLLYSSGHRFANFVHVRAIQPDSPSKALTQDDLSDNNIGSGYVGNVLNYHSPYNGPNDFSFLLEKVRILEVIRIDGILRRNRATEGEADLSLLRERFRQNNWPISRDFRLSLFLLVREGMLEVVENDRIERFSILPLGVVAVEKLITKLVYLENIFFGTLLPNFVYKHADDIERAQGTTRWAASSLFHTWLLLRTIQFAEGIGADGDKARSKFAFMRMLTGVNKSIEAMVSAEKSDNLNVSQRPTAIGQAMIKNYRQKVLKQK